jgi:hypothetical protein
MTFPITEYVAKSQRHASFYLACGKRRDPDHLSARLAGAVYLLAAPASGVQRPWLSCDCAGYARIRAL